MARRARLRTASANPETVAAALAPDNTPEMETLVAGDTVETVIERETTGGLRTTVDDYVVNLSVAERLAQTTADRMDGRPTNRATDQSRTTDTTDDTYS